MIRPSFPRYLLVVALLPLLAAACGEQSLGSISGTPTPEASGAEATPTESATNGHAEPVSTNRQKTQSGGRFALIMDGQVQGLLQSVIGGAIEAEVVTQKLGPENLAKKNIAALKYEPVTVRTGMGMSRDFYDWIASSFDNTPQRKNFEIQAADFDYGSQTVRGFQDALITEIGFPALDAQSKDPAYMTIQMDPEKIVYGKGGGKMGEIAPSTKKWQASNFRVEIGSLPTTRVTGIGSFTLKREVAADDVGQFREPTNELTGIEYPNLTLMISAADINPWQDWMQSFIVDGQSGDDSELTGAISFMGPDQQTELARIDLENIGIVSLSLPPFEANSDSIATFTVELYVERMHFDYFGDGFVDLPTPTPTPGVFTIPTSTPTPAPAESKQSPPSVSLKTASYGVIGSMLDVAYSLSDAESDPSAVKVTYSIDGGRVYSLATTVRRTELDFDLATSPRGQDHVFTWDAEADLGRGYVDDVRLRITPSDDSVGVPETSEPFAYSPVRDDVDSDCRISEEEWAVAFDAWQKLGDALVRCEDGVVDSFEQGLVEIGDVLVADADSTGSAADSTVDPGVDLAAAWDIYLQLEPEVIALEKAALSVSAASSDPTAVDDSFKTVIQLIAELNTELATVGDDAQLANIDLQNALQKQQQLLQTMSNVSKMLHDTAMAILLAARSR